MKKIIIVLYIVLSILLCSCGENQHKFKKGDIACERLTGTEVLIISIMGSSTYGVKYVANDGYTYKTNITDVELEECPNENIKEDQQHEEIKESL